MVRYKMLGLDINAQSLDRGLSSVPAQYRTWVVDDEPDFTGQYYTGEKSGPNALVNISTYAILDPTEVVNFNLPDPLDWSNTYSVLPVSVCDGQTAIIDGYVYLFGGINSAAIYRASLNTPTVWNNTGATLPMALGASQLAVIGPTIYLFGGQTGSSLSSNSNVILSAAISNPLVWTVAGSLPAQLSHSQLCITGGTAYLFGGFTYGQATNAIYSASTSDPLTWTNTGSNLPDSLYGSHLGLMSEGLYLFGGMLSDNTPTANIYTATTADPTSWSQSVSITPPHSPSLLPYPSYYGQFCTVAQQGYLFTPSISTMTTVASGSDGQTLPQSTIYVESTYGFLGFGNLIFNGNQTISYTGKTFNSFTGCKGGAGRLSTGYSISNAASGTRILTCNTSNPTVWMDTGFTVPGNVSQSHLAIVYDRIWLFGGNGNNVIFSCNNQLKYDLTNTVVIDYGKYTRTDLPMSDLVNDPYQVLGFAWWKTDYLA